MTQSPTDDRTRLAIGVCLAYFGARLLALAVAIDPSVPPDETTHVGRVLAYATTWGIPAPGPENHALGLLGERPFLYYWVMARVHSLASLVFGDGLLPLRLANAALAFATAVCGLRFVRVVAPGQPLTHVVFLVLLTNTLMFTGVAASVSYDNGANLLGAAAFYHLARFCRDRDPRDLASLAIAAGLGCLAKRSFLPVAALLAVGLAWHERRRLRQLPARAAGAGGLRVAALALVAAANLWLYGGNLIEYGRLVPGFEQVVGAEAARQNRIFARDTLLDDFREGRLDLREAMRRTSEIDHPADRESARRQLAGLRRRGDFRLGPLDYALAWGRIMLDRTFGYFGHLVIFRPFWERAAYASVLVLAIAFQASVWRRNPNPIASLCGALALAYAGVLLLLVNHPNYVERGILDAGVQGRYLFPVWVPLSAWVACALTRFAPAPVRLPLAIVTCAGFVAGDLPVLLLRASPAWFGGSP